MANGSLLTEEGEERDERRERGTKSSVHLHSDTRNEGSTQ